MKIFLYGLFGLIVLVVAAALIGPGLVDWNAHKDRLAAEVRKATGRDLMIDGDVHLAVLPAPALSADRVRFANVAGGSEPTMAELRELRVRIALLPLLVGRMQVESVSLVEPKILLEILADGRRNWEFNTEAPEAEGLGGPGESDPEQGMSGQIQLDSFTIESGTLIYRDVSSGREERIESLDAQVVAESLAGPFTARGDAELRGVETGFELAIGRLLRDGATPINLDLEWAAADTRIHLAGSLSNHPETLSYRGRVKGEGGDLSAALRMFSAGRTGALPVPLQQPFAVETEFSGDLAQVKGSELRLRLGETRLEGDALLELGPTPDLSVSLSTTRIDLDLLLSQAEPAVEQAAKPTSPAPAGIKAGQGEAARFELPEDVRVGLELAVEGVVYRGQAVRQIRFDAALKDGRATIGRARALLPGGSDLSVNGVLSSEGGRPRFQGRLEATSDNLRGLVAWLGGSLGAVPADRLRRMSFSGLIDATAEQVSVDEIDLRVDLSRATGGVVAALRQRLGLGIGLALDTLNLDAYLPAEKGAPKSGAGAAAQQAGSGAGSGDGSGAGPLALLDRVDANLDLRVGNLAWKGETAKDLRLSGTLQDGSLVLREAGIGEIAGSRAGFSGTVSGLATGAAVDGELEFEVTRPRRLAKALGIDPASLARLGRFTVKSAVKGSPDDLSFDSELAALGGSFGFAGTARPTARPLAFDVAVTARHPDLAGLVAALGGPKDLKPDLGALDLKGQVAGTPLDLTVSQLSGKLGGTDLSGRISADLSGPKPVLEAALATGELSLAELFAPAADRKQPGSGGGAKAAKPRWSEAPIDLAGLHALNAELALTARALLLDDLRLEDAALQAVLHDGVLDLKRLTGTLHGGAVRLAGKLEATKRLKAGLALTAQAVELGPLLREQADFKRVSGPVDLTADLTTAGASEAELIAALAGTGNLKGTLTYKPKKKEQLGALALNILGAKVKEVRGVADATTMLLGSFAGGPAALSGTFTVKDGVVVTEDTQIDGRDARALTRARADLPKWRLDSRTEVFRAADPKTPYLTARLKGPLDEPDVKIGGQAFQRKAPAPASAGGDQPQSEPAPDAPPPPRKVKPKDLIKDLLESLGN
ncbi:MAG: AsmA family protein [Rhodospirillales bacterium]|nr:AsmA family protein [Rhodospirillales bacterium]